MESFIESILTDFLGGGTRYLFFRLIGQKKSFSKFLSNGSGTQYKYNSLVSIGVILLLGAIIAYIVNY